MTSKIKILLAVLIAVVLLVVVVGVLSCGDDGGGDDDPGSARESGGGGGDDDGGGDGDEGSSDEPPPLRTVKVGRGEGENAYASAGAIIKKPTQIWLRVSVAPKQQVAGQWNVSCGGGNVDEDTYEVSPPHLMRLRIPAENADSCVAGASAKLRGNGRLKVAILRQR